jgi:hypothetical protein
MEVAQEFADVDEGVFAWDNVYAHKDLQLVLPQRSWIRKSLVPMDHQLLVVSPSRQDGVD